jgi:hypothetical protein
MCGNWFDRIVSNLTEKNPINDSRKGNPSPSKVSRSGVGGPPCGSDSYFFCSDTCTNAMAPDTNDRVSEATVNQAPHRNDAGPSTAGPANIAPIPGEKLGEGLYRKRALDRADGEPPNST